jgi:hypothetical protein
MNKVKIFSNEENQHLYERLLELGLEQSKGFVAVLHWEDLTPHSGAKKCIHEGKQLLQIIET